MTDGGESASDALRSPRLARTFFARDALVLARALLGKIIVHETGDGLAAARIVEVEAYRGPQDHAAHSFGGRRTARNEVMWGAAGRLYVYFVYGMHWCANVVAADVGVPQAVLLRAAAPVAGLGLMQKRRGPHVREVDLLRGPGNLCRALGIDGRLNGVDLVTGPAFILDAPAPPPRAVVRTTRVGVDYAGPDARRDWRFFIKDSAAVSRPGRRRRSPPRTRAGPAAGGRPPRGVAPPSRRRKGLVPGPRPSLRRPRGNKRGGRG